MEEMKAKRHQCGDRVQIARGDILGTIDEVIWCRGMWEPLYLVQWWTGGEFRAARFNGTDMVPAP